MTEQDHNFVTAEQIEELDFALQNFTGSSNWSEVLRKTPLLSENTKSKLFYILDLADRYKKFEWRRELPTKPGLYWVFAENKGDFCLEGSPPEPQTVKIIESPEGLLLAGFWWKYAGPIEPAPTEAKP